MMPGDVNPESKELTWGQNLVNAVDNKQVSQSRVYDMALRIVAAWYKVGQDDKDFPKTNFDSWNSTNGQVVNVQADHAGLIRKVGAASSILLKNTGNVLPLGANIKIAVIGSDAGPGNSTNNACPDHGCHDGTIAQGWGSGTANFPYIVTPLEGITTRALKAGSQVTSFLQNTYSSFSSAIQESQPDVVIAFVNANSGEDYITVENNQGDRNNISLWNNGDALIEAAAASNRKVVVVIHAPGAIEMPWINNPNVVAVIHALFPGQESGNAIADILFGDVNPSGRLPFTINKKVSDYSASIMVDGTIYPPFTVPQVVYSEGLLVDYRWNDAKDIDPLFEFGFGLSYSTFEYSSFKQSVQSMTETSSPIQITFSVRNTGAFDGHEVAQLYLGFPQSAESPPKQLKDFSRQLISHGQSQTFTLQVPLSEMQIWDVPSQNYVIPKGTYKLFVGSSSRNIKWTGDYVY